MLSYQQTFNFHVSESSERPSLNTPSQNCFETTIEGSELQNESASGASSPGFSLPCTTRHTRAHLEVLYHITETEDLHPKSHLHIFYRKIQKNLQKEQNLRSTKELLVTIIRVIRPLLETIYKFLRIL